MGAEVFLTDGRTDKTMLIIALRILRTRLKILQCKTLSYSELPSRCKPIVSYHNQFNRSVFQVRNFKDCVILVYNLPVLGYIMANGP